MPDEIVQNPETNFPIIFTYTRIARYFMLFISMLTAFYSLYFMIFHVYADMPTFFKILPMLILYISIDTSIKHLSNLNQVVFFTDRLVLKHLARKNVEIPYGKIQNLELNRRITYYVKLYYTDNNGTAQIYQTNASFPKMLQILLKIYEYSPSLNLDPKFRDAIDYIRAKESSKGSDSK